MKAETDAYQSTLATQGMSFSALLLSNYAVLLWCL